MNDSRRFPASTAALLALVTVLGLTFGCLFVYRSSARADSFLQDAVPVLKETEAEPADAPETGSETEPVREPVSYTIDLSQAEEAAGRIAARAGDYELTNAVLQICYLDQLDQWKGRTDAAQPDYTRPLDAQSCPLTQEEMTWQEFFLERALAAWQKEQAAAWAAAQPQIIEEEIFKPIAELHEEYVAEDLPVNGFLYGDTDCYTPNKLHQAWLDALPDTLDELAQAMDYRDAAEYAEVVFGAGVTADDLLTAAQSANLAYMYLTEKSYDADPDADEIAVYLGSRVSTAAAGRKTTVDIRHVLLIPEGAKIAEDGTVTASKEAWEACRAQAEKMLADWKVNWLTNQSADANFARMANENSADEGSRLNGGYYGGLARGELISELDRWAFSSSRIVGDTEVIRSAVGIHIVYLKAVNAAGSEEARQSILEEKLGSLWEQWLENVPLTVYKEDIALWAAEDARVMDSGSLLYTDVAHERFPEAITFLQQDYMYTPYGASYVGRGGCGITTMAMLATYMTDKIYTPGWLAGVYASYHTPEGTNGDIFRYVPAELGFYMDSISANLDDAVEALKNGQRVISLQQLGHFTRGGHYLLLQQYYEEDDTFQVRDSNIYNYKRLPGHAIDKFTRENLLSGLSHNYIMQKKIVRIPACSRCGDTFEETRPERLLNTDYTCEKCTAALARLGAWQTLMDRS